MRRPESVSRLVVVSANFGGGKEPATLADTTGKARTRELVHFVKASTDRLGKGSQQIALCVQEMTRASGKEDDLPERMSGMLGEGSDFTFVPTVSADKYPLVEKWGEWWRKSGSRFIEEGLATYVLKGNILTDPSGIWRSHGRVLDLPILEFAEARDAQSEEGWIRDDDRLLSGTSAHVAFRPTYYQGNRDTDPRVCLVHRVAEARPQKDDNANEFILVNLHLSTLRSENQREQGPDGREQTLRVPNGSARYLRWRQFVIIASFIDSVYSQLRLPVVVAGDFNAEPTSPEFEWFLRRAHLNAAFNGAQCWSCRESCVARIDGFCSSPTCNAPRFSHKSNHQLLDNILYTDSAFARENELRAVIEDGESEIQLEIGIGTEFSDHMPVAMSCTLVG